jgi:YD repeat-containing protein
MFKARPSRAKGLGTSTPRRRRDYRPDAEVLEARTLLATAALPNAISERRWVASLLESLHLPALKQKKAPKPAITASVVSGPDASGVVTVVGHTYAKAKVKLDIGATGKVEQTVKADKHGQFLFTFVVGLGTTSVRLSATAAGHKPTSTILAVNRLDRVPPAIVVQGLSPGPLARTEVTFMGAVTDIGTGVASLVAVVDGGAGVPALLGPSGNFVYITGLPLDGSADGGHQVQFVAVDQAGNVGRSALESFTLDTRAPVLTTNRPATGLVTATNITVTGHVADPISGIAALQAQVGGGAPVAVPVDAGGNFAYTTTLPLDGSADGAKTVRFTATNGVGNIATTSVSFTLDTRAPALTITSPAPGSTTATNVTVTGHVGDALSGIAALQAQVDGGAAVAVPVDAGGNFSYTTTLKLDGSADGLHSVALRATNGVGNTATASVSFTLSTRTGPRSLALSVTAPIDASALSTTGRLIGTVTETGTATPSARFSLDGGAFAALPLDSSGHFDQALSATPLAVGAHSVTVQASDSAGHAQQETIPFTVSSDFLVGASGTSGWGQATTSDIHLEERNSLLVQDSVPVTLGAVAQGARTISFQVAPQFDQTDKASVGGDRLLVALVDPSNPSQMLLSGSQPGTPLFALGKQGAAEFAPGLVSFDGTTVTIDVTSLTTVSTGLLVFQVVNTDEDDGTVVDIRNLADTGNPDGTPSSASAPPATTTAAAGPAVNLATLGAATGVSAQVSNVGLDRATGRYTADLQVMNTGAPLGRTVVVEFTGLPAGVTLAGASGTDSSGNPFVNLHDAIAPGGLGMGATSEPVPITVSDPSLVRFALTPKILDGGPELPPTLNPIGPITVMPGQVLDVPLQASDPNGDPITFSIQSSGPMPTSTLQANGTLVISPALSDIGSYHFTVVASNGSQEATQPVSLSVVADTNTHTRLSGTIANTAGQPLAGITIADGSVMATTASDGSFQLDFGSTPPGANDRLQVNGQQAGGATYPFIAEKIVLLLGHSVYAGVNNVITRTIYLPPLDTGDGATINPNRDTTVTTAMIPGASVFVKAGTLNNNTGQPFTGVLSITQVPVNLTPAALPANLKPSLVVTIQPGDMVFLQPAPLTLPNTGDYPPGMKLNLWSINPTTGFFDNVGVGQVSPDGSVIQTISGGIHNSSWHFFAPPPRPAPPAPPPPPCPPVVPAGSQVDLFSGDLLDTANLVGYQSLGAENSLQLTYDSGRAYAEPIVRVGYDSVDASTFSTFPQTALMATLTVQEGSFTDTAPGYTGGGIPNLTGGEQFWDLRAGSRPAYAPFQVNMVNEPTGQYAYTEQTGVFGFSSAHSAVNGTYATTSGQIYLVNDENSPFGSGWDLAGLQTVYPSADGSVMLVDGSGLVNVFQPPAAPGGAYVSQAGDFSTLVKLADGTFQRTMTDQTVYHFNASNQLARVTDRNGNVTTYAYGAGGHLQSITDPVGLVTHFTYTGNHITAITDPAGKVTQLSYDAAGNLVMITNPDGSHTEYQYDAQHHLIGETDPLGNQSHDFYDAYGRAAMSIRKDGSVVTFHPVEVQGLQPSNGPFDPFHAPSAGTNTAQYVDGDGHVTDVTFNSAGYVIAQSDGVGSLGSSQLNSSFEVTTSTDGNGYSTIYTYDAHGNVTSSQSEFSDQISGQITHPGDQDIYTFRGTPGQTFFYEGTTTSFIDISATLTAPSGASVFNINASFNSGTVILEESGTYQLTIAGSGGTTGSFGFKLFTPTLTTNPLPFGTTVSAMIANPGDEVEYTFTGTAGERIFYNPIQSSGISGPAQLFDPYGNAVFDYNWTKPEGPLVLTRSGTYTLLLSDSGYFTGGVDFVVTNPALTINPLQFGTTVTGSLNPGDEAAYTFTGTAGEQISYDQSGEQIVQIYNPDGNTSYGSPVTLTQSGDYTLLIAPVAPITSTYTLQVLDASTQPVVALNVTTSGTLNPGDSEAIYQVDGTAGQRLLFHSLAVGSATWALYSSSDQLMQYADSSTDFTATLDTTGTYFLIITGVFASGPVPYSFQVSDVSGPPQTPSGFGVLHSGTIAAGQSASFSYTAPPGLEVALDDQVPAPSDLVIDLLDSSNNVVFSTSAAYDVGGTFLERGGTYTLRVHGASSSSTGSYQFDLLDLLADSTPLVLGTPVSDSLPAYASRTYEFAGSAGDRVFYDGQTGSGLNASLSYGNPGVFSLIYGAATLQVGPVVLPVTGTYFLTISNNGPASAYSFNLLSPVAPVTPLTLNTTESGTLVNPGDEAIYTFSGTVGQSVFFDPTESNSGISDLLRGPLYDQILGSPATLPESGTYTLTISGHGAYGFDLRAAAMPVQMLALGTPISGTLANPGDQANYTFTATAGERIDYDSLIPNDGLINVSIRGPSGNQVSYPNPASHLGFNLPENGTYTLTISGTGAATGNLSFELLDLDAAPPVPIGTTVTGTLNPGLGEAVYQIVGTAGQTLYFHALGTDPNGTWKFSEIGSTSPANYLNSNPLNSDFQVTLTQSGTYTLVLLGQQSSGAPVNYSFQVTAPATPTKQLSLGATIQGNISQLGGTVTYTFIGRVGQRLVYNALQSGSPNISAVLTSPSGRIVFNINIDQNDGPLTLAEAGTYTLAIEPGLGATGPYAFQLQDTAAAPALTLGTTVSGTLNPGLSDSLYQLSGDAGQRLNFLSLAAASGNWALYGPANQLIGSNSLASGFVANLPVAGTDVLVIQGNSTTAPVSYQFQATDVSDPPVAPAGFGTVQSGTIAAGQTTPYTFTAPAGLPILFNGQGVTGNLIATLRAPSGTTVFSVSPGSDAGPYILQSSGNYTLTVQGNSASDSGSYQFQMLDLKDGSTPLALGTPVSGTLSPGLQAVSYSFTVPVGERVVHDALSTASTGVQALLYSAGGTPVFNTDANEDYAPPILLEGSYRLILERGFPRVGK